MVGVLLITHGNLGKSLIACAEHIFSAPVERAAAIEVSRHDDPDTVLLAAVQVLHTLDTGSGVLVLTDLFGGTPSNIATRMLAHEHCACVAGANLPMLLRALTYRHMPLDAVVEKALSGGRDGVVVMSTDDTGKQRHV